MEPNIHNLDWVKEYLAREPKWQRRLRFMYSNPTANEEQLKDSNVISIKGRKVK